MLITPISKILAPKCTPLYESEHWFYGNRLEEALHLFNPNINSPYRTIIESISDTIMNQEPLRYTRLDIKDPNCEYALFEFIEPFKDIPYFNVIKTLKVYHHHVDSNFDNYVICSPSDNDDKNYLAPELPMFEMDNHLINVMSIVMKTSINDKATISSTISHELMHALKLIRSNTQAKITNSDNKVYDDLKKYAADLSKNPNDIAIITPYGFKRSTLMELFCGFTYFCQPTEIEAHLDSAYNEYQNSEATAGEVLNILKGNFDSEMDELANQLTVIYNYMFYLSMLNKMRNNPKKTELFIKLYPKEYRFLLKTLHQSKFLKGKTLWDILNWYNDKLHEFIQKLASIILNPDKLN